MATISPRFDKFLRSNTVISPNSGPICLDSSPTTKLGEETATHLHYSCLAREKARVTAEAYAYLLRAQEYSDPKDKYKTKEYFLALAQLFKGQEILDDWVLKKSDRTYTAEFQSTSKAIRSEKTSLSNMLGLEMANSFLKIALRDRNVEEAKRLLDEGLEIVERGKQEDAVDQDSDPKEKYVDVETQKYRANIDSFDFLDREIKYNLDKENSIEILELIFSHQSELKIEKSILLESLVLANNNIEIFNLILKYRDKIDSPTKLWLKYIGISARYRKTELLTILIKKINKL